MKIYKVKVVAQVFHITDIPAESSDYARALAIQDVIDKTSETSGDLHINWTEILSEREEEDARNPS